ncbi:hypothetical protein BO86DRAFT_451265 [Aspergillus japonicus CBS 114.51]|uniref:Extracellular mutant protein 11 C-terminal domain-containing protein n=1 Tax=Aspergillus japonicus CBS 114.51 TaxID=1448312 RepID=A0A8T8WN91_ASPJA|nr:hypothetical protein BO86DRAFT_451265 [Aspergillus japonicus CBS 114.51]RAH77082.1 hypothetical protein BO86DRAFT_451265 [Aspergillus japonicus CBS 114.51]
MASVPSASFFSLPLPPWQQPQSARVAKYEAKKRKKTLDDWGDNDDDDLGETTDAASEVALPAPSLTLSPDEAHQYRVAGLSFDQELPGGKFPHAPAQTQYSTRQTREGVLETLSSLSSPIYPPQSAAHQGNLRLQHLAVLTSILHRCLLQKDYVRAGRAWGLLLREEFNGRPIDARTEGRWGIGAEILLRRGRQIADMAAENGSDHGGSHSPGSGPQLMFTRKGFEDAKKYYERLIIQHPYRKASPDSISSLHFYPAMFGLWVYVAQEESEVSRQKIWTRHTDEYGQHSEDEDLASDHDGHRDSKERAHALIAGVRKAELNQAQKIAGRMDEILGSPPYSDSPELLELRGMVSRWIADLFVSSVPGGQTEHDYYTDDEDEDSMSDNMQYSIQDRRERRLAMEKRASETQKSEEFFNKAKQRGKGVTSTLDDFHIDDNESMGYWMTMGVGDYVHARPPGAQPRSRTSDHQNSNLNQNQNLSSRQALAAQARVEVPSTNLIAPVPLPGNQASLFEHYAQQPQPPPVEDAVHRDMFDTDVEGIDDSTVAATSVLGYDDLPPQYQLSSTAQHHAAASDPKLFQPHPSQSHLPQHSHDAKWYASFGDNALKSAGFDSGDAADDAESQLTSVVGDDERSDTTEDAADYARRYRSSTTTANEPLSKRLQNFWSASRRTYQNATEDPPATAAVYPEPAKASGPGILRQTHSDSRMMTASQVLPLAGGNSRKVTLPRSMTATPRTRFSPPKPTLLEQLDLTPTRRTSGPRPQPGKDVTGGAGHYQRPHHQQQNHRDVADEYGLFDSDFRRRGSLPPLSAFDITNIDDLDNDHDDNDDHNRHDHDHEPINDPFSRRLSVQRISPDSSSNPEPEEDHPSKKRQLDPDYPPEVLRQMSFADLQSEPFDYIPNSAASAAVAETKTTPPPPVSSTTPSIAPPAPDTKPEEKLSHLLGLSDTDRREFFSGLTMDAWEDYGDLLIDQFSATLTKMKDLRRARRQTAAVFEAEIRRRHELVEEQSAELSRKLTDMKSGGAEVLRGRTPQ